MFQLLYFLVLNFSFDSSSSLLFLSSDFLVFPLFQECSPLLIGVFLIMTTSKSVNSNTLSSWPWCKLIIFPCGVEDLPGSLYVE